MALLTRICYNFLMDKSAIEKRVQTVISFLDERQKRIYLAAEAEALGWGGMGYISEIANVDKNTLTAGKKDLDHFRSTETEEKSFELKDIPGTCKDGYMRIRNKGGGRKSIKESQPGIVESLLKLVESSTYGNPENPLSWTTKSMRHLADELQKQGYTISHMKVKELLEQEGYTLQANRKLKQVGKGHQDRGTQFEHINKTSTEYM